MYDGPSPARQFHPAIATSLPRDFPSDWLPFPRLQLRGSAGFSPASLFIGVMKVREPNMLGKNEN
jgi:hypothetical protein